MQGENRRDFRTHEKNGKTKPSLNSLESPSLILAVENAREVVEEIVVCVNDQNRKSEYDEVLRNNGVRDVRVLMDEQFDHLGGPIVGILTGLIAHQIRLLFHPSCGHAVDAA